LFLPQVIVSVGNGMLLPNAIAGAVSVRPQAAGAASGITGFVQMAFGAAMAQAAAVAIAGAVTAMPLILMILVEIVLAALIYAALARPRRSA
jgi:DHA1 family bicyclomycin/chloramphenicol resistance-like MFS transporter